MSSMKIPIVRFAWNPLCANSMRESGQKASDHKLPIHLALTFSHGEVLIFDLLSAPGEFFGDVQTGDVG